MNEFFIYQYIDPCNFDHPTSITVIFVHQKEYDNQQALSDEIKEFFQRHNLSEKLIIILPAYADGKLKEFFTSGKDETFKRVPGRSEQYFKENYHIYQFDKDGLLLPFPTKPVENDVEFLALLLRNGTTQIFQKRGGLVESSSDHHFVFPSNKHCPKFIRTGNVLINSTEIFFIAFQLLNSFEGKKQIFCDTSSINVLPFSVFELKRRFDISFNCPAINSFESYAIFESKKTTFSRDALVLISSSTSGNIIDRLLNNGIAIRDQITLLFYIGSPERYNAHSSNIICNLTKDKNLPTGVDEFPTFEDETKCVLCKEHSRPILIQSDVFLTIQPKIHKVLITVNDAPKYLNSFVKNYRGKEIGKALMKVYYKEEETVEDYELFIDTAKLFEEIIQGNFKRYSQKVERLINTNIPANVKYLIYLPDPGSFKLAQIIKEKIACSAPPEIVHIDRLAEKVTDQSGSVVIVASSIVTGKHLLHISRAMRNFEKLSIVYFVGVFRTINEEYCLTLKKNLNRGKDNSDFRPVIAVEEFFCTNEQANTSWKNEKSFLEGLMSEINEDENAEFYSFIKRRREELLDNRKNGGLVDNVFLPKFDGQKLSLRKGFAFWNFDWEEKGVFQSEVYFTISIILNHLENLDKSADNSLKQSNYARSILSPDNFYRFNDGIIQASLLRAAKPECFAYDLDSDSSLKMKALIESMIEKHDADHGEALLEFLLAIGLKKLRLKREDQKTVLEKAGGIKDKIISGLAKEILRIQSFKIPEASKAEHIQEEAIPIEATK